jgi:hypothetical protein
MKPHCCSPKTPLTGSTPDPEGTPSSTTAATRGMASWIPRPAASGRTRMVKWPSAARTCPGAQRKQPSMALGRHGLGGRWTRCSWRVWWGTRDRAQPRGRPLPWTGMRSDVGGRWSRTRDGEPVRGWRVDVRPRDGEAGWRRSREQASDRWSWALNERVSPIRAGFVECERRPLQL